MRPYSLALFLCILCLAALSFGDRSFGRSEAKALTDHPFAVDDSAVLLGDRTSVFVLENDSPPPNQNFINGYAADVLTWDGYGLEQGLQGEIFIPRRFPDYVGYDSFTYRACTANGNCSDNHATVSVFVLPRDGAEGAGASCMPRRPSPNVGQPVNVTNGNMWLRHTDYDLPGIGENINIERFYNSIIPQSGLFGLGWSTKYDESLWLYDSTQFGLRMIRLNMPDGQAIYFGRGNTTDPFVSVTSDVRGQILKNTDGTFTLTFKDGRVHKFNSAGKSLWQKDRNGNQTTLTYDTNGFLTGVTDAVGRTLTFTPNSDGTISQISDSLGVVATYQYMPGTTQLQTVTYADNSKFKFEYTTPNILPLRNLISTVKDAFDNILETHLYDTQGRAYTSEKQGGVEKYSIFYNYAPSITITDALGKQTTQGYIQTPGGNLITRTAGLCGCGSSGSEITFYQYDDRSNLVKKTDALSNVTNYTYNTNGDLLTEQDVLGTESYTYNSLGEVLTATDRMGGVTANTFDENGNLLTSKDALNNTTTLTYTSLGQLQTIKDALNHTTTLTYDSLGRLTQVKDANNKTTNFAYDARARLTSMTNALNETTSFEYDLNNRLKKVTYPDTTFITYTYDLAGRRTAMTDARNNTTTYGYDNAYRLTSITDALNHTSSYGYDLMSNLISQTDALNNTTNYEYDDFNRVKKVKYPPAASGATRLEENLTYDKLGNVKTRVDTAGRTTSYDYDNAKRLIQATDAMNQITQFEYNARSQMTKVTDALSQQYTFAYDPLGRELSQTRTGSTMSFEYDAVGNRTKRTDYMGRVTNYEYDNLNRLKKINYLTGTGNATTNQTATYSYDDLSRLVSAVNDVGTVGFTYDDINRVKTSTDVFGHIVQENYDPNGNRTQLKLDGSVHTTYTFDAANRTTTLTDEASQNFGFGYDIANKLISKTLPNGITSTFAYDGMSRLKELKHQSPTATLTDNQYSYNGANQISQITELAQTKNFSYDNIDRLTGMTNGTAPESYAFDSVGNRTSSHLSNAYSYQPFNRVTSTQTGSYRYDANGNMASKSEGSNFWRYGWDYENRLAVASTGKQGVRYKYDALSRRTQRILGYGKENTKFIYDGLDVVTDDDTNSGITKYQNGLGIDSKLKLTNGGVSKYFVRDHLGSTLALTNSSGAVTEPTSYDSFGNSTNLSFSSRYQYTSREYDPFTGLTYFRARWYDTNLGRFISEDTIGFGGEDINLYVYVKNRPLEFSDPLGQFGLCRDGDGRTVPCGYGLSRIGDELFFTSRSSYAAGWRAESKNFPNGGPDGSTDIYGGAYRHCVATCYLSRRYSPFGGLGRHFWDWALEDPNDTNSQGDMRGEDFGEVVCGGSKSCEEGCLEQYPNR